MDRLQQLAWAAGLFAGEGNVGISVTRKGKLEWKYLHIQMGMYDERAVKRFAEIFSLKYQTLWLETRQHWFYKIIARGRSAESVLATMWPYLNGTDKADQAVRHATKLGVADWITGKETGDRPQLQRHPRGRVPKCSTR